MTKIMQKFTQNDITHLFAAQKYIQFVCFPFALLLSKMCVPWADLFCTDLSDLTDSLLICIRVFPCDPCSLFYSNTESHGFSRSLIHLHPCNPWAVLFCTDLTDTTDILFICIRLIRLIRGVFNSVRILRILRNLCSSASV